MSDKIEIHQVSVNLAPKDYELNFIVFNSVNWLTSSIYSEEHLENNKIFAICFDKTPIDKLHLLQDYSLIFKHYPNSNRILSNAIYIGNYSPEDQDKIIDQYLSGLSIDSSYNIVDRES